MKSIIFYILISFILTICYSPSSFAEEKTKTEKEGKKFKIPDWLDLYADVGYIYGKNYHLESEQRIYLDLWGEHLFSNIDVKGENIYDLSLGASILFQYKNIPIFFDANISNLYDGFRKKYSNTTTYSEAGDYNSILNWNISYPFISYSIGSLKKYSGYIFNIAFSYSKSIKSKAESTLSNFVYINSLIYVEETKLIEVENTLRNYTFSASISKLYKNFTITALSGFLRKNSNHYFEASDIYFLHNIIYKINEDIINLVLILSYRFKYINPYISFYNEIYNTPSIERRGYKNNLSEYSNKKTGIIINAGIHFSTSNILGLLRCVNRSIFHQFNIKELFSVTIH